MDSMPLILAIEPDRRQASRIASLVRGPLKADLLVAESTERVIAALADRWPDLILTSPLLSPKDEAALADWLRELDASGHHVQTLVIPVFASSTGRLRSPGGLLKRLRGSREQGGESAGCDPAVFAGQIAEYLEKASAERLAASAAREQALEDQASSTATLHGFGPAPVPQVEREVEPEYIPDPQPVPEPDSILYAEPEPVLRIEPESILYAEPEPVLRADLVPQPDSDLQPVPAWSPEPIQHQEPVAYAEAAATYLPHLPTPVEPAPMQLTDEANGHDPLGDGDVVVEQRLRDKPWRKAVLAGEAPQRLAARSSEELGIDASQALMADSVDLAAFVKTLSDSLLAAEQGAPNRRQAIRPPVDIDPISAEPAAEELAASSEIAMALDGLEAASAHDESEDDAELWKPLAAVVGGRWPHGEGEQSQADGDDRLLPRPGATASEARPSAPAGRAAPARRDALNERIEARKKKRQQSGPPQIQDEWGFFNPEECGFAALLAKLDEVTAANRSSGKRRV